MSQICFCSIIENTFFSAANQQTFPLKNLPASVRPRPQPITGTPPPIDEKLDAKVIQQTCTLFGLDLVRFFKNLKTKSETLGCSPKGLKNKPNGLKI